MKWNIATPDEALGACEKPLLTKVDQLNLAPEDCLILCAGFEDRALASIKKGAEAGMQFRVLLIQYTPFVEENRIAALRDLCASHHLEFEEIAYDRCQPAGFGVRLMDALHSYSGALYIDISAMSRLLIVQIIVALGRRPSGFSRCIVVYTEAENYPPSEEEARQELIRSDDDPTFSILFLSSGVFEITILPELSSIAIAGSQTRLIAFPSLDAHHLTALRVELQPSRYSFIEGMPPSPANRWRQEVISKLNRLNDVRDAEFCSASTLDYRETLDCLLAQYRKHYIRDRLLISPTGSKMQSVAVGLFRSFVEDVQIVYPTPRGFCSPTCYTRGIGAIYVLDLSPFTLEATQHRHTSQMG
ncbi:MAG: hypothetical protein P4L99_11320 [Chthoniobacter sp.]|nr:hypothetical protein [Chthoniobacter sp.]